MSQSEYINIIAGGVPYRVHGTTVAIGPKPGGGEMVADLSRFQPGDSVRILGDEGMDYRATVGAKS